MTTMKSVLFVVALYVAIVLFVPAYVGSHSVVPDPPAGCVVVGITNPEDEGFPVAQCADGSFLYADMDGGADHAPGTWVDASGYVDHLLIFT